MLTTAVSRGSRQRWRTLRQAWRPGVRGLPLPTLAAVAALAAAPTFVVAARGASGFDGALTAAALVGGAAAAFTVDDPADETLAASPTGLAWRRAVRASGIALGLSLLAAFLVAAALLLGDVGAAALGRRAAELVATAALSAAVAGLVHRSNGSPAAHAGAVGGVLGVLLVAALGQRLLRPLPSLLEGPHHSRWWLVAAAAAAAAAWTWRDPAR